MIVWVEASSALVSLALAALPAVSLGEASGKSFSDTTPHGAAGKVISSSWEQKRQEKEDEGEKEGGNVDDLGYLTQQTASCEDFRLHKLALAWFCLPTSNVLQVAKKLATATSRFNMIVGYGGCSKLSGTITDKGYIGKVLVLLHHFDDDEHRFSDLIFISSVVLSVVKIACTAPPPMAEF